MKRTIITIMLVIMSIYPSFATTMCAVNDSVAVVLDPAIGVSGGCRNDATVGTWDCTFPYGIVAGTFACLNKNTDSGTAQLTDTDNEGNTHLVTGSERYGQYCWCKLTHPVASRWVFLGANGSVASCVSNCVSGCTKRVMYYTSFFASLVGSVAP